nr:serine hydrolase domain-containing protein [uncultured Noviherbaspirillum sp.]
MEDMTVSASAHDFRPVRAAMQRYVDAEVLPGVSYAVLEGRALVDLQCVGWADREHDVPMRADHLFRAFSNTKLITSCAVLLLMEDGKLGLDDPVGDAIPQLAHLKVLKPGAKSLGDTEPARGPITVRHLLTHSAGLSYGLLDPGSLMYEAYVERRVLHPGTPLAGMMDLLAELPLLFHPGTSWEYSVASDVLARLVEVVSGKRFDIFLQERVFRPLDMTDTGFVVPESERGRLAAYYKGADAVNPMKPGLTRIDHAPYPGAYLNEVPRLSGGGGLVSSLPDMVALLRSLLPGGPTLLKPATIALAMQNHLADDVTLRFAGGSLAGKTHGLLGAITTAPSTMEPAGSAGELQWGGIAGTHWWIAPQAGLAAVLMTQRQMAFWHQYAFDFKRQVYLAAGRPV